MFQSLESTGQCIFECGCVEMPFHYMQCQSELLSTARAKGQGKLEKDLYDIQTALSLQEAILQGIFYWED
jgi:hypothetical protein